MTNHLYRLEFEVFKEGGIFKELHPRMFSSPFTALTYCVKHVSARNSFKNISAVECRAEDKDKTSQWKLTVY